MFTYFIKQKVFFLKVAPIVAIILLIKILIFTQGWELFLAGPLIAGIITANMFLLGFLLAGVLADYKEGEKIPGELAISLQAICDECLEFNKRNAKSKAKECLIQLSSIQKSLKDWLYKKQNFNFVMCEVSKLNNYVGLFEKNAHSATIFRMKQEISNIRRQITRIHTIRETSFVNAWYAIAEVFTIFLIIGLLFVKIDNFHESIFISGITAFVLIYIIEMIRDLDNPFEYNDAYKIDEISLIPLDEFEAVLELELAKIK